MTPVELRHAFNDAIDYYRRCWPDTHARRHAAQALLRALRAHPWLQDQIPFDVLGLAQKDATP